MDTITLIFTAVIPIFLVIGAGYLARRIGWLSREADQSLMTVVVNLLYPAFIFSYILGNEALRTASNALFPPLIGFTFVAAAFGISMLLARGLKIGDSTECRTFAFTTGIQNYGYFPVPIIALLFDRETTGVLLVHNVGVEMAMWAIGVGFILSPNDTKSIWRRVLSAPVISILIAVPLNWFELDLYLPNFGLETLDLLGKCAIPLGLILIGATFADLAKGVRLSDRLRIPITASLFRLGVFPVFFLFFVFLFPFSQELKQVLVVQAAMPCAVFPIVLSRHFGGSSEIAFRVVLSTTLISLVTIPLWISVGLKVIEW